MLILNKQNTKVYMVTKNGYNGNINPVGDNVGKQKLSLQIKIVKLKFTNSFKN